MKDVQKHLERAIEINPEFADAHFELALLLVEQESYKKARKHFEKTIEINSNDAKSFFHFAILLQVIAEFELSREHFLKAVDLDQNFADAYYHLGLLLRDLEEFEEAKNNLEKATDVDQNHTLAYYHLAKLLTDPEDYEQAQKNYLTAIDIDGNFRDAHYYLGKLLKNGIKNDKDGTLVEEPDYKGSQLHLQKAIDIGDQAFEETAAQLKSGITEREAAWMFEQAIRRRGAESVSFDTIVAAGPNAARPHHATGDTKLMEGQPIGFDCGARYQGYCSDLTRTLVLGEPDEVLKRVYDIVLVAQLAAIDMVKPGMTGQECDAIARKIISEAGHENNFGHSLGHGLGLEVHENPGVGPNATARLENGMPFTIEPGIYVPGWGGVRIEDVVVLEEGSARVMSHAAKMNF